jgi:hypothetical protein
MPPVKQQQSQGVSKPAPKRSVGVFVADEAFACEIDGQPYNVNKGERVREGHPLLKVGRFTRVEDLPVQYEWETR